MPLFDPNATPFDPGTELGTLYQQDAQNKIAQAKVAQQKTYVGAYANKYGISDVASKVKGLSDSDLYDMALNLVNKRRGPAKPPAGSPAPPKPPAVKPASKRPPAQRTSAPRVTTRRRTVRRPVVRRTATATTPKVAISATKIRNLGTI